MTPQQMRVINYINLYGSITPLDAFRDLGITKLATIVSQLKTMSFVFYQNYESGRNRFGEVTHFMRYWLDKKIFDKDMEENLYKDMFYQGD